MEDCSPLAATLMRKRHIDNKDIPDALQRGFMVFWERLVKDPQMLAEESKYAVAFMVEANCHQNYWKRHSRHISLDGLESVRRQSISGTRGVELMETWFTFLPHFSPELQEVISTLL